MTYNEKHNVARTLHHPSFLPLYLAADVAHHHRTDCNNQPVHPIIPAEFFYSDPSMSCGRRIPNIVSELRVLDCFQLNTPPPIMSACPAPPARPDPFRSGPHPTVDLGSLSFTINTLQHPVQPSRAIVQLTQEEDQATTNLLKLHHQEPTTPHMDFLQHPEPVDSTSAEKVYKPICSDAQHLREAGLRGWSQRGRCWSDIELEAAETLWSGFSLVEKDQIRGENYSESAETLPDHLQQQGTEILPASITDCTQKVISCSHVRESGEPGWGDLGFVEGSYAEEYLALSLPPKSSSSVFGVKKPTLSDSEGDAVHVLLSLRDVTALETIQ
ncbi:uncharacterized protein [Pagrus major]|uniref:uncharacterized protein n=1 Tax=Pagrus major TaxID=143350 RepID=UPI003CC8DAEE